MLRPSTNMPAGRHSSPKDQTDHIYILVELRAKTAALNQAKRMHMCTNMN